MFLSSVSSTLASLIFPCCRPPSLPLSPASRMPPYLLPSVPRRCLKVGHNSRAACRGPPCPAPPRSSSPPRPVASSVSPSCRRRCRRRGSCIPTCHSGCYFCWRRSRGLCFACTATRSSTPSLPRLYASWYPLPCRPCHRGHPSRSCCCRCCSFCCSSCWPGRRGHCH